MNEHYETIRSKTVCTECGGNDMDISYLYDGSGAVKKRKTALGMTGYTGSGNMLMIVCKNCGFLAKSFVIAR
jgi:hypothetical protein